MKHSCLFLTVFFVGPNGPTAWQSMGSGASAGAAKPTEAVAKHEPEVSEVRGNRGQCHPGFVEGDFLICFIFPLYNINKP